MAHQPYRDWITDPDELSASNLTQLNQHLRTCPDCLQYQKAWQRAEAALTAAKPTAAPTSLSQQVLAGVMAAKRRRQRRSAWLIFGVSLAGSLLLAPGLLVGQFQSLAGGMTALLRQLLWLWDGLANNATFALQLLQAIPGPPIQIRLLALAVSAAGLALAVTTTLGGIWTAALAQLTIRTPSAGGEK